MTDNAIVVEGIKKRYDEVIALDGVDLEVEAGTVFGLLGPNGAGKTTMVRVLATVLDPDEGRAQVLGYDVMKQADAVRRRIGLAGQYAAVDANLTGRENLQMVGVLARCRTRRSRRAPRSCSAPSSSPTPPIDRSARIRAACGVAWTSRPRSSTVRRSCSWTNPRPGWTSPAATRCGT